MQILAHDAYPNKVAAKSLQAKLVSLAVLLQESDFISLHAPLLESTTNLIGETELKSMRPSAILINTSRGEVINEDALIAASNNSWISGAGLDVFSQEPLPTNHRLIHLSSCVLTPHIGARTQETVRNIGIKTAENILSVLGL